jgi:hypothetical protein
MELREQTVRGRILCSPRLAHIRIALVFSGLGLVLAVALFPALFGEVTALYDDEGYFLATVSQFIHHGSLYVHTSGASYGPFYWSFIGLIYRLTGQNPTPFSGRLLVLGFTATSSALFAGAVWRVTRNLPVSILCQVTTFCGLIYVAGAEPISPGSTIGLLLSILVFALATYSVTRRDGPLVVVGLATGALVMTKINVGTFVIVGLAVGLVVGNASFPKWLRYIITAGAVVLPFALMFQRLSVASISWFAVLVSTSVIGTCIVMSSDVVSLAPSGVRAAACGVGAIIFVSVLWPLFNGTSPAALMGAVAIRPLQQVHLLEILPSVEVPWFLISIVVAAGVVFIAVRSLRSGFAQTQSSLLSLALCAASIGVSVLAITSIPVGSPFATWLPAIVLIPPLSILAAVESRERLALRLVVPIAILQVLHGYPVAGSQRAWATVVAFVPCAIALAAGIEGLGLKWRACAALRTIGVGALCIVVMVAFGQWPPRKWEQYSANVPLGLPGTQMIRVDSVIRHNLRQLTDVVREHCDAFYSVPGIDSLYIYTGIPAPTGQLANWAGMLTQSQEQEVSSTLNHLQATGKRVCIVRILLGENSPAWSSNGSEASRPIGKLIRHYERVIATGPSGSYSVSIMGS